jgi:DNA-directed RNA polymerase subunit RPC12/RpoP
MDYLKLLQEMSQMLGRTKGCPHEGRYRAQIQVGSVYYEKCRACGSRIGMKKKRKIPGLEVIWDDKKSIVGRNGELF